MFVVGLDGCDSSWGVASVTGAPGGSGFETDVDGGGPSWGMVGVASVTGESFDRV